MPLMKPNLDPPGDLLDQAHLEELPRQRSEFPVARVATGHALPALASLEIECFLEEDEIAGNRPTAPQSFVR